VAGAGGVAAFGQRITLGIVIGLLVGKVVEDPRGHLARPALHAGRVRRRPQLVDVPGLALLGGIGFTVSLLVGELAYGAGTPRDDLVKVGVLTGSLLAALLATVVLRPALGFIGEWRKKRPKMPMTTASRTCTKGGAGNDPDRHCVTCV
jgi:Na+:H+ antiporter, NhaA family